jgi:hypothetical protein
VRNKSIRKKEYTFAQDEIVLEKVLWLFLGKISVKAGGE